MTCGGSAAVVRRRCAGGLVPHTPQHNHRRTAAPKPANQLSGAAQLPPRGRRRQKRRYRTLGISRTA